MAAWVKNGSGQCGGGGELDIYVKKYVGFRNKRMYVNAALRPFWIIGVVAISSNKVHGYLVSLKTRAKVYQYCKGFNGA